MMKRATRHSRRGRASKRAKSDEHAADTRDDPGEDEEDDDDDSLWLSSVSVCVMIELRMMMKTLSLSGEAPVEQQNLSLL